MKSKELAKYKLPASAGVYFFLGLRGRILYIGKAGSLRDRVRSYFSKDIFVTRGAAIAKMVEEAKKVKFQKTDSVLEALILEAELIKKHAPKYNVRDKDDKSFNYVIITDESYPRILLIRGKELPDDKKTVNFKSAICNLKYTFGPFPHAGTLKEALRIIRKIFPFRDTCKASQGKPCFNRQIGLCPGVCTGEISEKEYEKTMSSIRLLFEGKKKALLGTLLREMKSASRRHHFEKAAVLRDQVYALRHLHDVSLLKAQSAERERLTVLGHTRAPFARGRIEAYDVAHTSGKETVGVMTVVERGEVEKKEYRKFILKTVEKSDDPKALKEIFQRRLAHSEWRYPELIVVDGGKAQVNAVNKVLKARDKVKIAVVGVVKDERHRPKKIIGDKDIIKKYEREILLANSEAHRFALSFHRKKMRTRAFTPHFSKREQSA